MVTATLFASPLTDRPQVAIMGGWALKLFCCDWDLDLIQDFDDDCGLPDLEVEHGRTKPRLPNGTALLRQEEHRRWAVNSNVVKEEDVIRRPELPKTAEADNKSLNYSLFAKLCSPPDTTNKVREHLDAAGVLNKAFWKLKNKVNASKSSWNRDPYGPAYRLCMLGACSMTHGAKISAEHMATMRNYYQNCGLMRDAVTQLKAALDPDTGYKNGTPWDFGSIGQQENMANGGAPKEDLLYPGCGMTNVWVPDHGRQKGEMKIAQHNVMMGISYYKPSVEDLAQTIASLFFDPYASRKTTISSTKADSKPEQFIEVAKDLAKEFDKPGKMPEPKKGCWSCEAETTKEGKALSTCGKCKKAKYCGIECQKKDWKEHKIACGGLYETMGMGQKLGQHGHVSFLKPT